MDGRLSQPARIQEVAMPSGSDMTDSQPAQSAREAGLAAIEQPARPLRVLLIEDNLGFAYLTRHTLRRAAGLFELAEATTLGEGLAILAKGQIDVVLLDLGLPDSHRIRTFASVRAQAPDTPVVILTVLDDDEVAMQAMRSGAQDYLVKDRVDDQLLVRSIRYAVERARIEKALRQLSARLLESQDAERRRIARDLHDATAQSLAALSMNIAMLTRASSELKPELQALIAESAACADRCSHELRTVSYLLHPPLLDELGLSGAVRDYADGFAARSGIRVDLEIDPELGRLPKDTEAALFRVMQECLTNIHRHSGSPTASIRLHRRPAKVQLSVQDKGRGIPPGRLTESDGAVAGLGVGIAGMRERIRQLGGFLAIGGGGGGATIEATLPLPEA
jgi:signal transduction histidine kinase